MAKSSFFLRLLVACLFLKQQFVAGEPSSDEVSITITMENNADNVIDIQNTVGPILIAKLGNYSFFYLSCVRNQFVIR